MEDEELHEKEEELEFHGNLSISPVDISGMLETELSHLHVL